MPELAYDGGDITPMVQSLINLGNRVDKISTYRGKYLVTTKGRNGSVYFYGGNRVGFLSNWRRDITEAKCFDTREDADRKAQSILYGSASVVFMSSDRINEYIAKEWNNI